MDIERLTKSQIVLLTLLVSFVTSIATGIVTVSLMQQAPPSVAQTVNRIIENTIQTVVATSTRGQVASAATVQQKTVIVNEADLISQSVKQVSPSIVQIYSADTENPQFLGLGIITNASGTVAADIAAINDRADVTVVLSNGAKIRSFVTSRDTSSDILYLNPAATTSSSSALTPATLLANNPTLGDVVVAIGGEGNVRIAQGIVTQIIPADPGDGIPATIATDIGQSSIEPGSVIVDTNGNVVGISTGVSRVQAASGFLPASLIAAHATN